MTPRTPARRTTTVAVAAAGVLLLAGCEGTQAADKTGGDTVVLHLSSIDAVNNNGYSFGPQAFIDTLASVSGGRVTVQVEETADRSIDAESAIVRDIAAGKLDGGWPASRAFASAGIAGLEAIEAPMTITSYAAEKELVTGPVAEELLAQLDDTGVVGLGLLVGPLRRPFAAQKPLIGPDDWAGATFRVFNSPVQTEVVTTLGGTPVNVGFSWIDEIVEGRLRGAEFDILQYASNGLSTEVGHVTTDVVLWPKVPVLSLSRQRYDSLTEQQQQWVREAAKQAVQKTVDTIYDEAALAQQLCAKGVQFYEAGPDQTRALQAKLQPVLDRLSSDPTSGPLLEDIKAVAANHPAPETPTVPATCTPPAESALGSVPNEVSTMPNGLYRVEITRDEVTAAGYQNEPGHPAGTWTLTVQDGTYEMRCTPLANPGDDCGTVVTDHPLEVGDLKGTADTVYFVGNLERLHELTGCLLPPSGTLPYHCGYPFQYRMDWAADGDTLTFTALDGAAEDLVVYLIKPWRKIG